MAGQAADVFISYKAEDRARLVPLVDGLEAEGFSVWWDAHIGGGANWRRDIEEHLDSAKCVLVAWTKRSVGPDGEFVRDEAGQARKRGTYLPVRLDAVELPLGFREVQALSLKGWHGDRKDARFTALADAIRERITGEPSARPAAHSQSGVSRRAVIAGAGIGGAALVAGGGWFLLKPGSADAKRIAVLPFANLSGDPAQAYFSDGIAEELRSALTRVGMQVIGRTSSDAVKDMDAKAAATKLGVANILTGSVRRSPGTIRVDAQLVSGADGVERWAQTYDRAPGDEIKIQTDIATNVADALRIALGAAAKSALTLGGTTDSMAQDLVLKSRNLSRQATGADTLRKCIALADAAIARDPNYADAYVERAFGLYGLATNFTTDPAETAAQIASAEEAADKALAIAPRLGSAHSALANVDANRLNFPAALKQTRQALALAPDDPSVLAFAVLYAPYLMGGQEASQLTDRFVALDPLNPLAYRRKAEAQFALGQYSESIEAGRKALSLAPSAWTAHVWIANSLIMMGHLKDAMGELAAMPADDPFRLTGEAIVAARSGDNAAAERTIARVKQLNGATASYQYAQIYAQLGQKDQALAELDNAVAAKDGGLVYLRTDPFLEPIRNDPRYAALVRKLGFS